MMNLGLFGDIDGTQAVAQTHSAPFSVLYADPPWSYRDTKTGGSMTSGAAQQYPPMRTRDICALDIPSITASDALLCLWTTTPLMPDGLDVVRAWGFTYKAKVYWHKLGAPGLGHWVRNDVEELWICTKGKVAAPHLHVRNLVRNETLIVDSPRLAHSEKPTIFRTVVEQMASKSFRAAVSNIPKIELFARSVPNGWVALGDAIDGRDIRDALRDTVRGCEVIAGSFGGVTEAR